jgi:hypothetical protein
MLKIEVRGHDAVKRVLDGFEKDLKKRRKQLVEKQQKQQRKHLMERPIRKLYHGTLAQNVPSIQKSGLLPQKGGWSGRFHADAVDLVYAIDETEGRTKRVALAIIGQMLKVGFVQWTDDYQLENLKADLAEHGAVVVVQSASFISYPPYVEQPGHPIGAEPGDWYSRDTVSVEGIARIITGQELLEWLSPEPSEFEFEYTYRRILEEHQFLQYLTERADKSRYAGFFVGLPRSKHYAGDKQLTELEVAKIAFPAAVIELIPEGKDPPDVKAATETGTVIGVEVSELVDTDFRYLHVKRRDAERAKGLTPDAALKADHEAFRAAQKAASEARIKGEDAREVLWSTYEAKRPTPGHISPWAVADWNTQTVAAEIDRIAQDKDDKLRDHTAGFDEICLLIHTAETMIDEAMVLSAKNLRKYKPTRIDRVLLVFSYHPAVSINNGYLVVEV